MPPGIALVVWLICLLVLLRYDPAKNSQVSWAVWIPISWMFLMGSRLPSQWMGRAMGSYAQVLEEGNSLDRVVLFGLIVVFVGILAGRSFAWGSFLGNNLFFSALLFFGLFSVLWSDYPLVSLKRWIRDLGNYLAIIVVLYEANPLEALRTFLRRLYYILIPLSILLIKYFPAEAIRYGIWSGVAEYVGAATSKNTFGSVCMLSGIFFFWDSISRWSERKEKQTKRILAINAMFILMSFWLLRMSSSATSLVCFFMGCGVILMYHAWGRYRLGLFKVLIPSFFLGYVIFGFGFGLNDRLADFLGRDATLTGRTAIWDAVLSTNVNPLLGTGYDTFWLGERLTQVWRLSVPVNQAHNGYLEFYLHQGILGLVLLGGLLISGYITICRNLDKSRGFGPLALAVWTLALFYNMTEAAFKPSFMCLTILLGAMVIPERRLLPRFQRTPQPASRPLVVNRKLATGLGRHRPLATPEKLKPAGD